MPNSQGRWTTKLTARPRLSLRRAVDFIPQGLAVFDADLRLVDLQRALSRTARPAGATDGSRARRSMTSRCYLARRGDLGAGDAARARGGARADADAAPDRRSAQRLGAQGQTLEFHSSRLPDGGLVDQLRRRHRRGCAAEAALERDQRHRSRAGSRSAPPTLHPGQFRARESRAPRPMPPTATRRASWRRRATTCCSRSTRRGSIRRR